MDLDEFCWLAGDEDCGVSLNCKVCDLGQPIAYYGQPGDNPYAGNPKTEFVTRIIDLYVAALLHVGVVHP